jgi:hypothetical protein
VSCTSFQKGLSNGAFVPLLTGVPQLPNLTGVPSELPWTVRTVAPSGHDGGPVQAVPYGPGGDVLPERFAAEVTYTKRPLRVRIECSFDGMSRVRVKAVSVERTDGKSVTPEDMTATNLGAVMGTVVEDATRHGGGNVFRGGRSRTGPPTDDELLALARMYWFEYVSWGKPRQEVMSKFELPRSTANAWIRKAREKYHLPGVHAESEG